jgi:TRAP-type C4-dicarboxylate transport system permease small subunit
VRKILARIDSIEKVIAKFSRISCAVGFCFIGVIMLIAIFSRLVGKDIEGSFEISQFVLGSSAFLGLSYVQIIGGHIKMETLTSRLPRRVQLFSNLISIIIALAFFALITWKLGQIALADYTTKLFATGLSFVLYMWPFESAAVLGCLMILIVLIFQLIKAVFRLMGSEEVTPETATKEKMADLM